MDNTFMKDKTGLFVMVTYFFIYVVITNIVSVIAAALMYFTAINQSFIMLFVGLIEFAILCSIVFLTKNILINDFKKIKILKFLKDSVIFYALIWVVTVVSSLIILALSGSENSVNQELVEQMAKENPIYSFFAIVIFAPIVEELVFRGAIFGLVRQKYSFVVSTAVSAISFAAMHFTVSFLTGNFADLIHLVVYIAIAIPICLSYEKTRNIYIPIAIHLFNNLISIITIHLV